MKRENESGKTKEMKIEVSCGNDKEKIEKAEIKRMQSIF